MKKGEKVITIGSFRFGFAFKRLRPKERIVALETACLWVDEGDSNVGLFVVWFRSIQRKVSGAVFCCEENIYEEDEATSLLPPNFTPTPGKFLLGVHVNWSSFLPWYW